MTQPGSGAGPESWTADQDDTADQGPLPPEGYDLGVGRGTWAALIAAVLLVIIGALMTLVHLPYVIMQPGPITNTLGKTSTGTPLVSVSGISTYPTTGELNFTTVSVLGGPGSEVNAWMALRGWLDPASDVVDENLVFPSGVTNKQVEEQNAAEMAASQQEAIAVALRSLGKKVVEHVLVAGVSPSAPSGGALKAGDEILSVGGKPVTGMADVQQAVQSRRPGETVHLVVRRAGDRVPVDATTGEVDGQTVLGVYLKPRFEFPFDVSIDAGNVGGPSAGMMFSLAVRDVLTPGDMTGGADIAGTGTISDTGQVGPIGGIHQKLVGASRGGASWFLAPAANCSEVVGNVPAGLHVVKVSTYDDAVSAVRAIAADRGSSLPTCTAASSG